MKYSLLISLLIINGCATTTAPNLDASEVEAERKIQKELEVTNTIRYQKRLDYIAYPLLKGGAAFCDSEITAGTGLKVANQQAFPDELREAAKKGLGLSDKLEILWVTDNTPASGSGIIAGDIITHLNNEKVPVGEDGLEFYQDKLEDIGKEDKQLTVNISRDGQSFKYLIQPDRICAYPTVVVLDATPNAFADGNIVAINSGLLRLFDEDRDVAIVVGHEIAHNVKHHVNKGIMASVLGLAIDIAIGIDGVGDIVATKFSPSMEAEADYVGLYIAINSGVDINGAENIWRGIAAEFSGVKEKTLLDTHPPTPERYVAIRETVKEINEKIAKGRPLVPNQ